MGKRGPKPGSGGRPRKALYDNLIDGNPGKRQLMVLDDIVRHDNQDLRPPAYMKDDEKAIGYFNKVVDWLKPTNCLGYIYPELIGEYAVAKSRWQLCCDKNKEGLLAAHPTTGQPMQSPYVNMELQYLKIANELWEKIWNIVKENSTVEFRANNPNEDVMEQILRHNEKKT